MTTTLGFYKSQKSIRGKDDDGDDEECFSDAHEVPSQDENSESTIFGMCTWALSMRLTYIHLINTKI